MKVLTANRLTDGEAVWLGSDDAWHETIENACVARDKATEERFERLGQESFACNEVVDVDLIDVELRDGEIRPIRLRERIRAAGPTNRTDLGKQARPRPIDESFGAGI